MSKPEFTHFPPDYLEQKESLKALPGNHEYNRHTDSGVCRDDDPRCSPPVKSAYDPSLIFESGASGGPSMIDVQSILYRAQYECRHCLERFEGNVCQDEDITRTILNQPYKIVCPIVRHQCTPDILGVADLQCFIRQ